MFSSVSDIYSELKKDKVTLSKKYTYSSVKTRNKIMQLSLGRIWFNILMPDKYKLVDEPVTKKKMSSIIKELLAEFGPMVTAETLDSVNKESFKLHNFEPVTFSDDDFIIPDSIAKLKDERLKDEKDPIKFNDQLLFIAGKYVEYLKSKNSSLYKFIASGAKGGAIDVAVLIIARGSVVDMEGNVSIPSANSVNDGFNLDEFYDNANQARNGLHIRSIGAAEPGALARDIAYANAGIMLSKTKDCKTKKYLEFKVTKALANSIVGRVMAVGSKLIEITEDVANSMTGKIIKMRSPLYCVEPKGICHTCYGKLGDDLEQTHIGLLAASTLNTQGLNAFSMKARHSSSVVQFKETDLLKDLIR